jgi:serine/threonine protein kinase
MLEKFPNPGEGYTIREYLGGGHWKSAFRASTPFRLADVALLFFHENVGDDAITKDATSLIRTVPRHRYSGYLARFYSLDTGPDGRIFIVEELLARPLDRMCPLNNLTQFVRIARDLSRGLTCLHEQKPPLVHRDLKLDNCGLDHQQRAKIFDLGSVTSDPGDVLGTIFTRAPELFTDGAKCDTKTDVWALGATLFALRTANYPFVNDDEIAERRLINSQLRTGAMQEDEARRRKEEIDAKVRERIMRSSSEAELAEKVHETIRGRSKDILLSMLRFDRSERSSIQDAEGSWSLLARDLLPVTPEPIRRSKWDQIKAHLEAVERNETRLTTKQLDKIISDYDSEKVQDLELKSSIERVKKLLTLAK